MMRAIVVVACALVAAPVAARNPVTDAQLEILRKLAAVTPDADPQKPDILFRIAELYSQEHRYYAAEAAGATGAAKVELERKDSAWLLAAIKQFLEVVDHPEKFGAYARTDEMLYWTASLLMDAHKEHGALTYSKRLIAEHPKSKFIADAFLSFGEYYFSASELDNALKFYDKVLSIPDGARLHAYARYKEAWCYFNRDEMKEALAAFVEVACDRANPQVAKEARKDAVRVYARIGEPDKARDFFRRLGDDDGALLDRLAEEYRDLGRAADCRRLARGNPCD